MSTLRNFLRPLMGRHTVVRATVAVAVVSVSVLAFGVASGRPSSSYATGSFGSHDSGCGSSSSISYSSIHSTHDGSCSCGTPSIVTTQQPASGPVGATYKDEATLSGLGDASHDGDSAAYRGRSVYRTGGGDECGQSSSYSAKAHSLSAKDGCEDASKKAGGWNREWSGNDCGSGSGSITFKLYSGKNCSGSVLDAETVTGVSSNGNYTTPKGVQIENAGTYYWVASFSGESKDKSVTSGCNDEPVGVGLNNTHLATSLSESAGSAGDKVHDSAALTGGTAAAGGQVSYGVYGDAGCTAKLADAGTVNVTNGSVPRSNDITFNVPGTYYWQARYSGDANNAPALSNCTDEKLVIASSGTPPAIPRIDLAVTKTGAPNPDEVGNDIIWTLLVTNNGPATSTGVTVGDPIPAGNTFVAASATQGSCANGAILSCSLGTIAPGGTVTITLVTKPTVVGTVTNTVTVVGNETETNTANNTASASVVVNQFTGPAPRPSVFCVAVSTLTPHQLFVGRKQTLTIHLSKHGQAVKGVRVLIKGPKLNIRTRPSNAKGIIKQRVRPSKAGIVVFTPLASPHCGTKRLGVTGVFTPPVTG